MARYLGKRFLRSILTLFIILSIVFILVRQMPIDGYFPNIEKMTEAQIQNGLHQMGLDQPLLVQLFNFFKNLILKGDLGMSRVYRNNVPVTEILAPRSRKVKILATLGPASSKPAMIKKLMVAGADAFRINMSHGTHDQKAKLVTARPTSAHQAESVPRKPFISRMCSQAA